MTPKEKLRNLRNEMIPPKLERGCEILIRTINKDSVWRVDEVVGDEDWSSVKISQKPFLDVPGTTMWSKKGGTLLSKCEILGKPVSTNDVLRMLDKTEGDSRLYIIDTQGQMWKRNGGKVLQLNLSLDNIELQDEETLKQLLEIL